jgi:hypothetical protein
MAQTNEDSFRGQSAEVPSNRAFGLVFAVVFLAISCWPLLFGGVLHTWLLIASALVAVVSVLAPALLTIPNQLWQRFGRLLHLIVSPIVLALMFFLVVTPTGLLMRLLTKQSLRQRRDAAAATYWIKRDPPGPKPESLPHQF